jgi:hypothetical protein
MIYDIAFLARHLILYTCIAQNFFVLKNLLGLLSHSTLHCSYVFALFCLTPSQALASLYNRSTLHYNPLPVAMHHRAYYILVFTHAHTELLDYRLQAKERTGKGMHPPLGTRLLQYM